jgi:hypothetical protein
MGLRIPESLGSEVSETWLRPHSRNEVAAICGISLSATSGIIDEWKRSVGVSLAEQLRGLATTIERPGISVAQSAQRYRISRQSTNLGVDEDDVESFFGETHNRCIGIGIGSQDIASHLKDLISFALDGKNLGFGAEGLGGDDDDHNDFPYTVPPILQIATYLEKSKVESKKLELKNQQLKKEAEFFEARKLLKIKETALMLKRNDLTTKKLDWYVELETEVQVSGYSGNDYLKAINLVIEAGHNLLGLGTTRLGVE